MAWYLSDPTPGGKTRRDRFRKSREEARHRWAVTDLRGPAPSCRYPTAFAPRRGSTQSARGKWQV